jgi:hypothetical protein
MNTQEMPIRIPHMVRKVLNLTIKGLSTQEVEVKLKRPLQETEDIIEEYGLGNDNNIFLKRPPTGAGASLMATQEKIRRSPLGDELNYWPKNKKKYEEVVRPQS